MRPLAAKVAAIFDELRADEPVREMVPPGFILIAAALIVLAEQQAGAGKARP